MHIMSGYCTPIPLVPAVSIRRDVAAVLVGLGGAITGLVGFVAWFRGRLWVPRMLRFSRTGTRSTADIAGQTATHARRHIMEKHGLKAMPMVALTMDMEYAHLDGYDGAPIYRRAENPGNVEDRNHYYEERTGEDEDKQRVWLRDCYWEEYETWGEQLAKTREAAAAHPWRLVPMYHFDPRRWGDASYAPFHETIYALMQGGPDMRSVLAARLPASVSETTPVRGGPFIGFKMYPALGYRACDFGRLPQLKGFYGACEDLDIPILSHLGAREMHPHDRGLYYAYDQERPLPLGTEKVPELSNARRAGRTREDYALVASGGHYTDYFREQHWKERYYDDEYKSPENWERVLKDFPNLRLCLAHMGSGETPDEHWTRYVIKHSRDGADPEEFSQAERLRERIALLNERLEQPLPPERLAHMRDEIALCQRDLRDLGMSPRTGDAAPTEPPLSGWEFRHDADLGELYRTQLGVAPNRVQALAKFTPWNRTLVALITSGKHPNLYMDISYFFLMEARFAGAREHGFAQNQELYTAMYTNLLSALKEVKVLRRRILFGSDWYMTQQEEHTMDEYIEGCKALMEKLTVDMGDALPEEEPDLWTQFAVINPWRFYRFDDIRPAYTDFLSDQSRGDDLNAADKAMEDIGKRVAEQEEKLKMLDEKDGM
jgi:predicted TIM-barrel fold metal-dependent hydrolase